MTEWCITCGEESEQEVCASCQDKHRHNHYKSMGLRPMWERLGWDDFKSKDTTALQKCREYAQTWPHERGLIISSKETGNGKSLLAACILKEVGVGFWANVPELLDDIRAGYGDGGTKMLQHATSAPLLVLDDIGAHKHNEWTTEKFYILINTRYESFLPIVATTNLEDSQTLTRCYGERTVDRLVGCCDVVRLHGKSWRRK